MLNKMIRWFDKDDQKLLTHLNDEKYLKRLEKQRISQLMLCIFFELFILVFWVLFSFENIAPIMILLVMSSVAYLDADHKIKLIKLVRIRDYNQKPTIDR